MRAPLALTLLALGAPDAAAQDLRAWQGMYEGMLLESVEGDLQRSSSWYEGLIDGLEEDDPTQGEMRYWLGRTRYLLGETREARALLLDATDSDARDQAGALLGQIDALELQIRELPVRFDFADGPGPWIHPWYYEDQGSLGISSFNGEGAALAWTTQVTARRDDQLHLGFAEGTSPQIITFRLTSGTFPAWLLVAVEDAEGRLWRLPELAVASTDAWTEVRILARDLQPLEADLGASAPAEIRQLVLVDRTARSSFDRGENTLYIDDVEIR